MAEWWVIDKKSGSVVTVLTTSKPGQPDLSIFRNSDRLEATTEPTETQREAYRWWRQR